VIMEKTPYLIPGFYGVREALVRGHVRIKEIWIAEGKKSVRKEEIIRIAGQRKISIRFKERSELSQFLPDIAHQGIAALTAGFAYSDLDHLIDISLQNQSLAVLIGADHITDEGNLGSLIRTAAFFGAHGLIIPKKRSAAVSAKVFKRSSGAYAHLPIARVVNLGRALDLLKSKGFWIIGASGESPESIYQFDWKRDLILVLGNEHQGLSRTVRERCHQVVGIPKSGHVESLNVGVAGGVILSEIFRQRKAPKGTDIDEGLDQGAQG
jgi:23S rRNA (guanosine2251-2'-O)-methyltransferase